jgi:site-specific DNA recombinase
MKTAVIYARYSSDLQKDRSIDDQIAHCRQLAERNGYQVAEIFVDRAKSAASMFERDGLLALMNAAKKRDFNAVVTESLSRLSRDQEDTAAIYKRLKFNNVNIIDTSGEVTDVHVGVGGIVNSMFLKNLAISVKRAKAGRAREGLIPGRTAFGYRGTGKPGEREIDPLQAAIVLRIFGEYDHGKSLRDIAVDLANENIVTPGLVGGEILRNQIYIGKLVWNANSSIKNPENGRRVYRASTDDKFTIDVPHLRIIPQPLWDRVEARRVARKKTARSHGPRPHRNFDNHMLAGLLTCGGCGGNMIFGQTNPDGSPRAVCTYGYRRIGGCTHYRSYSVKTLERTVLDGIKRNLTNREALLELTKAYHARYAERQKIVRQDREATQQQLNRIEIQMDRIVTAISDSDDPVKGLVEKLNKLRIEHASLKEQMRLIEAESNVVTLHPAAIDKFADAMEQMHAALSDDLPSDQFAHFRAAFRTVFERVTVHPTDRYKPYEVTPYARLGAIMGFELFPKARSVEEMLAEQGVTRITMLPGSPTCIPQDRNDEIVSLGKWLQAA